MNEQRLEELLKSALPIVKQAGDLLRPHYGKIEAETKETEHKVMVKDVVTRLDRETEEFLLNELKEIEPTFGFKGEEYGVAKQADTYWLVDPIDGTHHFIRGNPFCSVALCLIENEKVVIAILHDIASGKSYWARKGGGAFCEGERLEIVDRPLSNALLSMETHIERPENYQKYLEVREKLGGFVQLLSSSSEFIKTLTGETDGKIGYDSYGDDWDFAPGALLIEEAGGICRNIGKTTYEIADHNFIFTNRQTYADLTEGEDAPFPMEG